MKLYVNYHERLTEDYWDGEEYGDWRKEWEYEVRSVGLSNIADWGGVGYAVEEFETDFVVDAGDTVYVLWMTYRTGDTFGYEEGRGEVLWLFKNRAAAEGAREIWEANACNAYSVEFFSDTGRLVKVSSPAAGYFEDMGRLELSEFVVAP